MNETMDLYERLNDVDLTDNFGGSDLEQQLAQVVKFVQVRDQHADLDVERAMFMVRSDGWDMHHSYEGFSGKIKQVDDGSRNARKRWR